MTLSQRIVAWARRRSPWITVFNSGACNGCDIEVLAALTPRFDVERLGVLNKGSPRHADILLVTGPVTRKQAPRLRTVYEQMPEPKYVVALGACGAEGGIFKGLYHVVDGVDKVVPVDVWVGGCPPRPDAIIDGILRCVGLMEEDAIHGGKLWRQPPAAPGGREGGAQSGDPGQGPTGIGPARLDHTSAREGLR